MNEFIVSHAASFTQKAGETALMKARKNWRGCWRACGRTGPVSRCAAWHAARDRAEPDGAFYLFPRIAGVADSFAFCQRLLEETRVGLAPEWRSAPAGGLGAHLLRRRAIDPRTGHGAPEKILATGHQFGIIA